MVQRTRFVSIKAIIVNAKPIIYPFIWRHRPC